MQLRTKLLFSLVLVTAGLTCATLLVVWHSAQVQVQREMEDEARNAILAFQVVQQQHQIELSHKADLLATLAVMRNGDATTIQDVRDDPWHSENCDLFVLVDPGGKIVAMHTTAGVFPVANAEDMFRRSVTGDTTGWWYSGTRLYQVVLQRFYADPPLNKTLLGTVIVGRGIDNREVSDLRRISASQVVLRYGGNIVVSTLNALKEWELNPQIHGRAAPEQVQIDNERYLASSI
jgi:hypothetical protein